MSGNDESPTGQRRLQDKINQAFETLHPADRGPYSNREVVAWLQRNAAEGETSLSLNYLGALRSGDRDNPTLRHLQALARFFGISTAYFLEDGPESEAVHADLQLLAAMRDNDVRGIAARALDLDPQTRAWLHATVVAMPNQSGRTSSGQAREPSRFVAPPDDE